MSIILRNPHSVLAVFETRPKDVLSVTIPGQVANSDSASPWSQVAQLAREHRITVQTRGKGAPSAGQSSHEGGRVGTAEATVRERVPLSAEELFSGATDRVGGRGLWLALDCLQDPHNIGAIFRVAGFFGVQGVLLTQERSAPLTGTAYDVASGGIEHVPFAMQTNLQNAFSIAKEAGLWILGTSEHAHDDLKKIEADRPWLLVMGNEEKGMRRLTSEACDVLCRVSPRGKVTSLNVSVAAGIFISHLSPSSSD